MLNENIRTIRKNKGYSQEELAVRLHVTRQTISKWEKGTSVPDAAMLSDMAEIFDISVSELLGEAPVERHDQDAVIEQLSRINEQMAVRNRRSSRIIKALAVLFLILAVSLITAAVVKSLPGGGRPPVTDHIGKLTYVLPDYGFEHEKDDVGITIEDDGRERISAKLYKRYDDMTQLGIWEYDYSDEDVREIPEEFRKEHKDELMEFSGDHGDLPDVIDGFAAASDVTEDGTGRYYEAIVIIGDKLYQVDVENGDDPVGNGELLIATMDIDDSLTDEYR